MVPASTSARSHGEPEHEVVIIGAGFSGIGAGIQLKKAGIDSFVILEQASDIGGTWRDNTYPGIAVDITSFTYSFSFEQNPDWSRVFAPGQELKAYADHCADKYGLRPHLRLGTKVDRMVFNEQDHLWVIHTPRETFTARFVISGTGALTQPKLPDIEGIDEFEGMIMHTARWDHSCDLAGKRVAVIGTGATGVQVIPTIAPIVEHLDVYQRTPIWILPKPDAAIAPRLRSWFRRVPGIQRSVRLVTSALTEVLMTLALVYTRQLPWLIRGVQALCVRHLHRQVPDAGLRTKLMPHYGFGCKRPSFSSDYFPAFLRDDVELITEGIECITRTGIQTRDGKLRPIDALICATGFHVYEKGNMPPYEIVGLDGQELGRFWDERRYQAYEGASVPAFPNYFLVLGPYSASGSSWFSMVEAQVTHALRCIQEAHRRRATFVEVKREAHDAYFRRVLRRQKNTVFFNNNCSGSNSYHFDRHGDAPFLRPSSGLEMRWHSRHFDLEHYRFLRQAPAVQSGAASAAS